MDHIARDQGFFDVLLDLCQIAGAPPDQVAQGPFAQRDGKQVLHHLAGACQGKQLLLDQVGPALRKGPRSRKVDKCGTVLSQ